MKTQHGYTILEVLIAVIILAIILPALSVMVIGGRQTQLGSLRFENAAAYAQRVYDSLSLLPPTALATGSSVTDPTSGTTSDTIGGQKYTADWVRTPLVSATSSSLTQLGGAKLTVTVSWTVGRTKHQSVLTGGLE